jgi:hypothetical protein
VKVHSYVIARDYGFAPNPFFGICTLATCKPKIRKSADIGDWVVGTGSAGNGQTGRLVFAMKVAEALTFDEYWKQLRFRQKRPNLRGSKKQAFGDNIYHRNPENRRWLQIDSHHSHEDGTPNTGNIRTDTSVDRVLLGTEFVYWGARAPIIPKRFRDWSGIDICAHRGHKNNFPLKMTTAFAEWLLDREDRGVCGLPTDWKRSV